MEDDAELVLRCLNGDEVAIRTFVEQFHSLIFKICMRRLRNREDAEDVTQESLVRSIRYMHRWDAKRSLTPWVLKIAMNCCLSHLRQRGRQIQTVDVPIEAPGKPLQSVSLEMSEEFATALSKIRDEHRMCFTLFHLREMSIPRIAEIMSCPEGTVKTWLHRARLELGRQLIHLGVVSKDGYELQ